MLKLIIANVPAGFFTISEIPHSSFQSKILVLFRNVMQRKENML